MGQARAPPRELRVAPITAPGEIHELPPPAPRADSGLEHGRATLRLLGLEEQVNRPLEEDEPDRPGCEEERSR